MRKSLRPKRRTILARFRREDRLGWFIERADRARLALLPETIDDYVGEDKPVRVVDAFVEALNSAGLGFDGVVREATGRPSHHTTMLKIYVYGYLNQVQSSRGLECRRNLELIWLTGRLAPDFKTIAGFRRDSGPAIRKACAKFNRPHGAFNGKTPYEALREWL